MAQLLVRNLPDDVKARLTRRAKKHGRSLEAEARAILSEAPEDAPRDAGEPGLGTRLAGKLARHKVTKADWELFDDGMRQLRRGWRVRKIDLGS
jgi:plasmid stability protein